MTEASDHTDESSGVDLGPALRALRRRADLSQRQLAERSEARRAAALRLGHPGKRRFS